MNRNVVRELTVGCLEGLAIAVVLFLDGVLLYWGFVLFMSLGR